MNEILLFTEEEKAESQSLLNDLVEKLGTSLQEGDEQRMRESLNMSMESETLHRDVFGLNPVLHSLRTAMIAVDEEGLKRDGVMAILLYTTAKAIHIRQLVSAPQASHLIRISLCPS